MTWHEVATDPLILAFLAILIALCGLAILFGMRRDRS